MRVGPNHLILMVNKESTQVELLFKITHQLHQHIILQKIQVSTQDLKLMVSYENQGFSYTFYKLNRQKINSTNRSIYVILQQAEIILLNLQILIYILSKTMSQVGLTGISNISFQALQTRYQKALRQINKLIEVNRQLKDAADEKEGIIGLLKADIDNLKDRVQQLEEQNIIINSKYLDISAHCTQLENFYKEHMKNIHKEKKDGRNIDQELKQCEKKYSQQLQNGINKYNQLALKNQILHQVYKESLATLETTDQKSKANQQVSFQLQQKIKKLEQENQKLKQLTNQDLRKKVQQASTTIEKLIKECSDLKNRQIDLQLLQEKQKTEKYLGFTLTHHAYHNEAVKLLVKDYLKKIQELQTNKKDLQGKYKHLKQKLNTLVSQSTPIKIQKLQKLTQKQQIEISRLVQTYDKQISFLYKENRKLKEENKKLKEGNYSLSQKCKQKSMDLKQKEKQLYSLKYSSQMISYQNQSLKKVNSTLMEAATNNFAREMGFNRRDFEQQSFTMIQQRQSQQRLEINKKKIHEESFDMGYFTTEKDTGRSNPRSSIEEKEKIGNKRRSLRPSEPDFRFIHSMNIISAQNLQSSHVTKQ